MGFVNETTNLGSESRVFNKVYAKTLRDGITVATPAAGDNSTKVATTAFVAAAVATKDLTGYATEDYVDGKVADLVNSAPEALDTLKELADALNNDANYAATINTALGTKADKSDTYTKTEVDDAIAAIDLSEYATETYVDNAITNLVNGAPEALNTLKELSDALGSDANFASTVTTSLASKANKANPIPVWTANTSYVAGNQVIHEGALYTCSTDNNDAEFDEDNWVAVNGTYSVYVNTSRWKYDTDGNLVPVTEAEQEANFTDAAEAIVSHVKTQIRALTADKADTDSPEFTGVVRGNQFVACEKWYESSDGTIVLANGHCQETAASTITIPAAPIADDEYAVTLTIVCTASSITWAGATILWPDDGTAPEANGNLLVTLYGCNGKWYGSSTAYPAE